MSKPLFRLVEVDLEAEEAVRCQQRRGPASRIRCEIPTTVSHDWHMGRGRAGQWFLWLAQ